MNVPVVMNFKNVEPTIQGEIDNLILLFCYFIIFLLVIVKRLGSLKVIIGRSIYFF
jgi:hypothetical protein